MLVDTLGLLLAVVVTAANADDGTAAPRLLERVDEDTLPRLSVIFGDNKYNNKSLRAWMEQERPNWSMDVQSPPPGSKGFSPVRIRWVVERSNAWHGRCRRNSKDYERRVAPEKPASNIRIDSKSVVCPSNYDGNINALSWHPDGARFISFDERRSIRHWNADGTLIKKTYGHFGDAQQVSWCHEGQILASSSNANQQVRLWTKEGSAQAVVKGQAPFAWHSHEKTFAALDFNWGFQQWDVRGLRVATTVLPREFATQSAA